MLNKSKALEKLAAFLMGFLLAICILEISLRLFNFFYDIKKQKQNYSQNNKVFLVCCLGDSFTEGLGAPPQESYPAQLQELLRQNYPQKNIEVINLGKSAYNTSMILDTFRKFIENAKPNLVVIMAGGANRWNYLGYSSFSNDSLFMSNLNNLLYKSHLYRMFRYLAYSTMDKAVNSANYGKVSDRDFNFYKSNYYMNGYKYSQNQEYEKACNSFKKAIEIEPGNYFIYQGLSLVYQKQGNFKEAVYWLKKGVEIEPGFYMFYYGLGENYRFLKEYDDALKCYTKGLEINPYDYFCCEGIGMVFQEQNKTKEYIEYFKRLSKFSPVAKDHYNTIKNGGFDEDNINLWIKTDVKKIIGLCRENKIKIILMSYPDREISQLRTISQSEKIEFVDNYKKFSELFFEKGDISDYFVPDGHCNSRGYGIIAQNIYEKICEKNIIENRAVQEKFYFK